MLATLVSADDVLLPRIIMAAWLVLPIVAMAGGFPCCCTGPQGSTSTRPGSTSTSTGQPPPLPTSTSTGPPIPLPPRRRSSSVGILTTIDCLCCIGGVAPDQWQIEVSNVTPSGLCDPDTDSINGVFIVDELADNEQVDSWWSICTATEMQGCGKGCTAPGDCGVVDLECASTQPFDSWMFFAAAVHGTSAGTTMDVLTVFSVRWQIPPSSCGQARHFWYTWHEDLSKPALTDIGCVLLDESEKLDCTAISGTRLEDGFGGVADVYIVEGF